MARAVRPLRVQQRIAETFASFAAWDAAWVSAAVIGSNELFALCSVGTLHPSESIGPLAIRGLGLRPSGHLRHGPHHFGGVVTDRRLAGQHHRVGAVEDGVGDVAHLGTGRRRRRDHRLEHLRRGDHRDADLDTVPDDLLLEMRNVLDRTVDAEVATSDHHHVGGSDDLGEAIDRRARLDLGDQLGPITDHRSDLLDVDRRSDERHRDVLDARSCHRFREHQVLRCRRGQSQGVRREMDAGAPVGLATGLDHGDRRIVVDRHDAHRDRTVTELHTAHPRRGRRAASGTATVMQVASLGPSPGRSAIVVCATRSTPPAGNEPARTFGPGKVGENGDRTTSLRRHLPNPVEAFEMILQDAVAQVQPDHVDAGIDQVPEHRDGVARRTQRRDDLRPTARF